MVLIKDCVSRQGGTKVKISKLGNALAFCLALSTGQAHAEPWQVTVVNSTYTMFPDGGKDINWVEFYPQGQSSKNTNHISAIIKVGKSGIAKFDKPTGVCVFSVMVVSSGYELGFTTDVCKSQTLNVTYSCDFTAKNADCKTNTPPT